jgi:PAS domain S-box-containing protein
MKTKGPLNPKLYLAFGAAILVLLGLGATSYRDVADAAESDRWVRHTREVLESLQYLCSAMARIESSYRGYVLTGKESYVESSRANVLIAEQSEATLGRLTEDNPRQRGRVPDLERMTAGTAQFGERVINLRRAHGLNLAADAIRSGAGQQVMDKFQMLVRIMEDEERGLLVQRIADSKRHLRQTKLVLLLGTLLGVLIAGGAGWTVRRDSAARDIAEKALREGEERFRTMANNISQLAWMADEKGSIFWYNQRWFDYSGTTLEEMIGWGWQKVLHPDHVQRVMDKISRCFQSGEVWEDTFPLRGRDGNYRWFLSRAVPIRDSEGKVLRWFGTNTDISESRDAEKHLLQMESRYRGLLEAAPDAMVVVNEIGQIVLLNVQAEKQFGYRRDELVGRKVKNLIPEGFAERLISDASRSVADALAQQIGTGIELSGRRKDGSEFPIEIMLSPLESAEGILVTVAIRNISARKKSEQAHTQLENQATVLQSSHDQLELRVGERTKELAAANQILEQSNLELKQFAYVASHDLQSPLRSISGFVQLLKSEYDGKLDKQADDWIRRTVEASGQMQTMIRDVLAYSTVDSRSRPFAPAAFLDVFNDAAALLESSIHDGGGQVSCGELPVVMGDRSQLVQLMQNLISNGLKYHGDQAPSVHVSAESDGNEWTFSVRDNGIGIDPKYYDRIFEIFKRLHDQTEYPGTGIGLAVCRRVVTRHGGRIWLESEAGHGSVFHFTIPEGAGKRNDQHTW